MTAPQVHDTGGGDFQRLEPGTYPAVCTWVVGIGPQPTPWGTKEKIKFRFEVPTERIEYIDKEGIEQSGPAVIWATWTASLAEKAQLRKILEAWRGQPFTAEELSGFDLDKLLGAPCMIVVVHEEGKNGRIYDNIDSVSRLMKGLPKPQAEGELIGFDPRNYTDAEFNKLPEWAQRLVDVGVNEIKLAEDLDRARKQAASAQASDPSPGPDGDPGFTDDDIPF